MNTFLSSSGLCLSLLYLHFSTPRLCPSVLFLPYSLVLHCYTAIALKFSHKASASQQNVDRFLCTCELSKFWQKGAKAAYCKPVSFTTFAYWAIAKIETIGAAACWSVTDSVQLVVPGSNPDLYQDSAVRGKLNEKSNGRIFEFSTVLWRTQTSSADRVYCGDC